MTMGTSTQTRIESIAQRIEEWGDGWRFLPDYDSQGRRARIARDHDENIVAEIEIQANNDQYFIFAGCRVRLRDGRWQAVSLSMRNPVNRRAIEFINHELDAIEGST